MFKYFSVLFVAVFLISCKTKTNVNNPVSANTAITSNTALFKKIKEIPPFDQLKINSKVDVQTGKFIPTLDATIYIEKDQKVWMNIIAVFLNVGRGIATPDGIRGYEKWNKTYIESDFSYLNNLLQVNFIDFSSLQNLLIGKTFIPLNEKDFKVTKNADGYQLTSEKPLKFQNDGKMSEYEVSLNYTSDFDLMEVNLNNVKTADQLEISYSNWITFENMRLPQNVKLMIKGTKTSQILLENTKFERTRMETPYSVPNNYTKTEIK